MNRQDFIFTLFDNGNGLTLDQISVIEESMIDTVPDGMIEDLIDNNGMTEIDAEDAAIAEARQVFLNSLNDCGDMLELKNALNDALSYSEFKVSDMQVKYLWYVTREV